MTEIRATFDAASGSAECAVGSAKYAVGDAERAAGIDAAVAAG